MVAGHGDSMMTGAGVGKEDVEASPEVSATLTVLRAQGLPPCVCALPVSYTHSDAADE